MTARQRGAKSHPARLLSTLLALCFIVGATFDPLPAQEPWNPEARRLLSLVPESTSSLQRDHIRAGMQRDGYPALEAEFTGGADLVQLFIVHETLEGGRTAGMLEDAMDAGIAERWVVRNLEVYRIVDPGPEEGVPGVEQLLFRVPGPERTAWIMISGPEGEGDALRELADAMELERLAEWQDEFADGTIRRTEEPAELRERAEVSAEGGTVSFAHPEGWIVTDISDQFSMSGPFFLVSREPVEDPMFAIRPEPMVLGDNTVVAVSVGQPIGGELEDRITSSDVNSNLFEEFEGIERPHRVEVAGHPAMMAVYAGTDARGQRVINRHVIMRPEGREIHLSTYVPEDVWQDVAPLLETLITSLRIAG